MAEEQAVEEEPTEEVAEEKEEVQVEEPAEETEEVVVEEVVEEPVPPKKKQTAQERIDEVTRFRREAEREAAYWRKAALDKKEEKAEPPKPEGPATPKRPTIDQFETTEMYEDALFEWRDNVKSIETASVKRQQEYDGALRTFNDRAKKLRGELEDFDEVIESPVFTPSMRMAILHSENGPQLAYHLGRAENRETAERLRNMPVEKQLYEMGKLETQLLVTKQTKKVPGAPAPIKPVGMSGAGGEVDPSKMTMDEWKKWDDDNRLKKIKERFGGPT